MSKNLFIIQGINKTKYMTPRDVDRAGFSTGKYILEEYIDTESIFDKHWSWLNTLPKGDQLGDVFRFYMSPKVRGETRELLRTKLAASENKVDVLAHSLGTIITLTAGTPKHKLDFGDLYLMGSPLALKNWLGRKMFVHPNYKKHVRGKNNEPNITCDNIYFAWSRNDDICHFANTDIRNLLQMVGVRGQIAFVESDSNHNWESYIIDIKNDVLS